MIATLFVCLLGCFIGGALTSLLFGNRLGIILSNLFAITGSLLGIVLGTTIVLTQQTTSFISATSMPLFTISHTLDLLAGYLIIIIGLIGCASSIYGIGYMRQYANKYHVGSFGFFYNLFLLSLFLVVTASNSIYFLFVWEIMSLTSFFLVIFEYNHQKTISAGLLYFIMTHIGTMCILAAFLLLYSATHTFDFGQTAAMAATIPEWIKNTVFVFALIGFGTKAGIIPLHIWLPKAHSAAPSHVSALMSGVMIKMGIFMLFRLFLDIIPGAPLWWGIVILIVGALSSLLGVLYALAEHDLKRLLAYHSIENIGIILLGLGSSMIFVSLHLPLLAALAATAGLFHTLNHAIFKSLLFLGAGAVIMQTGTRNLEKYGGLIKVMPYTALFFLIGAVAISGLPPLNGFASEWLAFQSLFAGTANSSIAIRSLFLFAGGALALTGGLAAACFVKAFGSTFLARPRSSESQKATEVSWLLIIPMAMLALLCVGIGFGAGGVINLISTIVGTLQFTSQLPLSSNSADVMVQNGFAQMNMQVIVMMLLMLSVFVFLLTRWVSRRQKVVRDVTWDCGYAGLAPHMEITATGFSRSLVLIFKGLFQPTQQKNIEYVDANVRYFTKVHAFNFMTKDVFETYWYHPLYAFSIRATKKLKQLQNGNLNMYILYLFLTLIGLLLWVKYA